MDLTDKSEAERVGSPGRRRRHRRVLPAIRLSSRRRLPSAREGFGWLWSLWADGRGDGGGCASEPPGLGSLSQQWCLGALWFGSHTRPRRQSLPEAHQATRGPPRPVYLLPINHAVQPPNPPSPPPLRPRGDLSLIYIFFKPPLSQIRFPTRSGTRPGAGEGGGPSRPGRDGRGFGWKRQFSCTLRHAAGPPGVLEIGVWAIFLEAFKDLKAPRVAGVDFQAALNCPCPTGTSERLASRLPQQSWRLLNFNTSEAASKKWKTNEKGNFSI